MNRFIFIRHFLLLAIAAIKFAEVRSQGFFMDLNHYRERHGLNINGIAICMLLKHNFSGFLGITYSTTYGDCIVFDLGEVFFDPPICHFCAQSHMFEFCKIYTCPQINCTNHISSGCCQACPGTCNYGGNIYNSGDTFACLDGVSQCRCTEFGHIDITRINVVDIPTFCGADDDESAEVDFP